MTVATICEAAGVSLGLISHYFPGKDALLLHAVREVAKGFEQATRATAAGAGQDPLDRLHAVVAVTFREPVFTPERVLIFPTEHTNAMTATHGPAIGPPDLRNRRVIHQEERLPELARNPSRECAGNQEAPDDVRPDRGPVHNEIVADRRQATTGSDPLPKAAAFGDQHVHFGMAFHPMRYAFVSLSPRFIETFPVEKPSEQQHQESHHERAHRQTPRP